MEQALDDTALRESEMAERPLSTQPTPRIERLKQVFVDAEPIVEIDRDRIYTRVMRETDGEPMAIRRAKAFCAVVREMPVSIAPDEIFVGHVNATWSGVRVSAESGAGILGLLKHMSKRRPVITAQDEKELREEIVPYWQDTMPGAHYYRLVPEEQYRLLHEKRSMVNANHFGHLSVNYEKVLKKGFLGIKREAEERLAGIDYADPDELRKLPFLKGVVMAMEAASEIGPRFAARARELANEEEDGNRKAELLSIAEVCDWVPANPARTLHEAMQAMWFAYILVYWEAMNTEGIAVARPDQYLYPYYEKDLSEGRVTEEQVQEWIDCWTLRLNIPDWTLNDIGQQGIISASPGAHLSVGGYKADGSDGTNALSYMFIEAMMHLCLPQPHFSVQVHSRTPDDLLIKASQLCSLGVGHPQFENADVLVPGILTRDTGGQSVTLEDARGFASVGCQEPVLVGNEGLNPTGLLNAPLALEFALSNGVGRRSGEKLGLETGDPRRFETFEEVCEAYRKQFRRMIKLHGVNSNIRELTIAGMHPTVFASGLIDDCIENGMSREEGGARYNAGPGLYAVGLPDNADSLAAIKKVVFEDRRITMAQLCDALDDDFQGHEEIRRMLLEAPKYGNDDDGADELMVWLTREWAAACKELKNTRGGRGVPGMQAFVYHIPYGKVVGALPSGRLAGEALSDGASPCFGSDVNGPTAVLRSLSKVNNFDQNMTETLNMTLDPVVFKDDDGIRRLADFIRTLVDEKIQEVQINVVSPEMLRAAQREPEKYQGLVVKVAGYSAFFVKLMKGLQDAIISRSAHRL